jgi:hypothetical protein
MGTRAEILEELAVDLMDYAAIRAWGARHGARPAEWRELQQRAAREGAPADALYLDPQNRWVTLRDLRPITKSTRRSRLTANGAGGDSQSHAGRKTNEKPMNPKPLTPEDVESAKQNLIRAIQARQEMNEQEFREYLKKLILGTPPDEANRESNEK